MAQQLMIGPWFWPQVERDTESGCWNWTGSRLPSGYGRLKGRRQAPSAHRFSYEQFIGPIGPGLQVCHRCDNPPCVNPMHLFSGTAADNMRDRDAKGRGAKPPVRWGHQVTHCRHGHEYTPANSSYYKGRRRCLICHAAAERKRRAEVSR
jgi:HNH endonuclease